MIRAFPIALAVLALSLSQAPAQQSERFMNPWVKIKIKGATGNQTFLMTGESVTNEEGKLIVGASVIEAEGGPQKILRVMVAEGIDLKAGTRVMIDKSTFGPQPFASCQNGSCISDYGLIPDMLEKMKSSDAMVIEFTTQNGTRAKESLPLANFARIYDGLAVSPEAIVEQQKKIQEELQKKADDMRRKLEQQPSK